MTGYLTEENSVEAVLARIDDSECAPRFRQIMESLVTHLHGFIREVELTQPEWETAIDFLTRTGQKCSAERQEFILLSDTLGVSMLVDAINNRRDTRATENTVLGPFHVAGTIDRQQPFQRRGRTRRPLVQLWQVSPQEAIEMHIREPADPR